MKKLNKIIFLLVALVLVLTTYSFGTENDIEPRRGSYYENDLDNEISNEQENVLDSELANEVGEDAILDDTSSETGETTKGNDYFVNNDFYSLDSTANITMDVNGNVFVVGEVANFENVYIDGDVFVFAREVNFDGTTITGSVFIGAQNLKFNGNAYDAYILASRADFLYSSTIGRNARIAAETVYLDGEIYANAYITGNEINVGNEAVIYGDLSYTAETEAEIPETANIGNVNYTKKVVNDATKEFNQMSIYMQAISFVFKTAIVSAFILICGNKFIKMHKQESVGKNIAKSIGNGAVSIILIPILIVVLIITIVGAGLGVVLLGIYIMLIYFASAIAALSITYSIFKNKVESKLSLWIISLVVAAVIWGIGRIPVIGWVISVILVLMGLGAAVRSIFYKSKKVEEKSETKLESDQEAIEDGENKE